MAKSWRPAIQGWNLPPHATPWLWACDDIRGVDTGNFWGVGASGVVLNFNKGGLKTAF